MKTAIEIRGITNDVLTARDNQRKSDAIDWVEKCVSPFIEQTAQEGKYYVRLNIDIIDLWYAGDYLKDNGYKVEVTDGSIRISW